MFFFAQSSQDILSNAAAGSQLIAQGFDQLWQQTLNGNLYGALMKTAQMFALATLSFYMVDLAKSWMNQEDMKALSSWIWPILIIGLMANNGALLRSGTLTARDYINQVNNDILSYTAAGADLETAYNRAVGSMTLRAEAGREMERCRSMGGSSQDAANCLQQAEAKLRAKAPEFFKGSPPPAADKAWDPLGDMASAAGNFLSQVPGVGGVVQAASAVWDTAMGGVGELVTGFVTVILLALNNAYQWCVEFALLLTALLGPLAVGASLLPFGQRAIFAWLSAIMGCGMAKLSFNIICGLCGQLVSNAQANQPMIFLLFVGLLSPLLATALGTGGGMAAMGAMAKGGEMAAQAGAAVATAGASEVKIQMAKAAARTASKKGGKK